MRYVDGHARRRQPRPSSMWMADDRTRLLDHDAEVEELGRIALVIEGHYGARMDLRWGKDGVDGQLYVLRRDRRPWCRGGRRTS